ncbi:RHS repeat-associated core domain-containing protein [Streptomyces sp. NPDC096105]|uniref:RHS repeat-associated core domain-containing protein n=1 Tax=Streptomyces sp. NPDC096105 TaxID=3366074 RepID=UPI003816222A
MAGHRPTDWHVLDLDKDPTPGDPERVRRLAKFLHDFADDVSEALRLVKGMAGEGTLAEWAGKSATVFKEEFSGVPKNLRKLEKSYAMCGDALADYWPRLERAQALADKALAKAREARADLSSAQSRLASAESWVGRATREADKYKDDPTGARSDADKPDEAKVRAATRDVRSAKSAQEKAQSDVSDAQDALAAAKKMAADARKMREEAARDAKSKIDEASDAGIRNRSWWEEIGDWVTDNWDSIVAACKIVVAVVGIVAMIIGGPILGAIVLIAALVVLADTLYKYSKGQASLWDVGLAALDCIPGMKGLTTLGGLAKGMRGLGSMGLKGMALGVKGLGKGARALLGEGAKGAFSRMKTKIFGCGDPVDVATGAMYMQQTDVELPGTLPLRFTRRAASNYRCGWWFGPTWSSTLDQRLEVSGEGIVFVTEDGMLLSYEMPGGLGVPVHPQQGPRWPLTMIAGGGVQILDSETGHTRTFAPPADGLAVLERISDRNGNTITFDYGPDGTPATMRHSGGYNLAFTVADGKVTELIMRGAGAQGADVTIKRFLYTGDRLTGVVGSFGVPLQFAYDDRLRITEWTDTNGSSYRYSYDARDRCTAQGGEAGHVAHTFTYDGADDDRPGHRVTTVTSAAGAVNRYVINGDSQVVAEVDPLGACTTRTYDAHHRLLSHTDPLGRTTRVTYDGEGRPSEIVRPDGARTAFTYSALGLPVLIALPDGTAVRNDYDERGNRTAVTDADGATLRYTYTTHGHLCAVTDPLGRTTTIRTDRAGLPLDIADPLGGTVRHERDAFGRTVKLTDQLGSVTVLEWSLEGLLTRQTDADGTETWMYDGEGNCVRHEDTAGHVTTYEYTHFDLLAARTDPSGARTTYTYDADLRLTQVTVATGDVWHYTYDAAGRLVSETDFDGVVTRYSYDLAGQLVERTNCLSQTVCTEYDLLGRVAHRRVGGQSIAFRYDPCGRLLEATGPDAVVTMDRDELGRVLAETTNNRRLTHTYDHAGNRRTRTTPSGAVSSWSYDAAGGAVELVSSGQTVRFERDRAGRETVRHIGDHMTLAHTYDPLGRRRSQTLAHSGRTVNARGYHYRPEGHLDAVESAGNIVSRYETDATGHVTSVHGPQGTERYVYDPQGNLTYASWPAELPAPETAGERRYHGTRLVRAGRVRYEYDAQGRVTLRQKTRLSRKPDTWRYEWDAEDRLTAVTTPDGSRWTYLYDPLGRRIAKQRHAQDGESVVERTDFVWDGTTLCEQTTWHAGRPQAVVVVTWDHQGRQPIAQTERILDADASQEEIDRRFFGIVTDLVGAPTELVSSEGEIAWQARATLWGNTMWNRSANAYTPLRFPGQYFDPETGLHYNVFRHYDPETARYVSGDPLGLAAGLNPFAYVSNPLTWSDPLGLTPCEDAARLAAARNETVLGPNVPTRVEASLGSTTSHNYKKTFFDAHPHLKGKVVVHHAIEQQVLKRYPGLFSADEMHSLENLRGIPKGDINSRIHLSQIRVEWNKFYDANPNPTRQQVLDQVTKVDDMLGNWFSPRIR